MGYWEGILPYKGGEALAQVSRRSCGCPGSVQGQVGQGLEQLSLLEGVLSSARNTCGRG